jgi:hypothetical protein
MRPCSPVLALLALVCAAPAARAADPPPDFLPVYGSGDGVRLTQGHPSRLRFGAKAAKLYRTIAGGSGITVCRSLQTDGLDGDYVLRGRTTLPARRSSVRILTGGRPDVCALATDVGFSEGSCRLLLPDIRDRCARVIVAVTALGRTYVDRLARSVELTAADAQISDVLRDQPQLTVEALQPRLGVHVVALASADASPPPGQLGVYGDAADHTVVVLLADGSRRFLRRAGEVISTNVEDLLLHDRTVF